MHPIVPCWVKRGEAGVRISRSGPLSRVLDANPPGSRPPPAGDGGGAFVDHLPGIKVEYETTGGGIVGWGPEPCGEEGGWSKGVRWRATSIDARRVQVCTSSPRDLVRPLTSLLAQLAPVLPRS